MFYQLPPYPLLEMGKLKGGGLSLCSTACCAVSWTNLKTAGSAVHLCIPGSYACELTCFFYVVVFKVSCITYRGRS